MLQFGRWQCGLLCWLRRARCCGVGYEQAGIGIPVGVAITGRIGSGKDTAAELLEKRATELLLGAAAFGRVRIKDIIFAQGLAVLDAVGSGLASVGSVKGAMGVSVSKDDVEEVVRAAEMVLGQDFGGNDPPWPAGIRRTAAERTFLQALSAATSRAVPGHYARLASAEAQRMLRGGMSVLSTDCRLPVELQSMGGAGLLTAVLKVPESERIRRVMGRDGSAPSREQLSHPTEEGVDGCEEVADIIVDGHANSADEVVRIIAEEARRRFLS